MRAQNLGPPAELALAAPFAPLDFVLRCGEALCLRGASGSGKSTVLAMLALTLPSTPGSLSLLGRPAHSYGPAGAAELRRRHLGILRQRNNLFGHLSVAANVALQARLAGDPPQPGRLAEVLQALELTKLANRPARLLSGGEEARVGLARLLYQVPRLALVDEPTAGQDPAGAARVVRAVCQLRDAGCAVVLATHDGELARSVGPSLWLAPAATP